MGSIDPHRRHDRSGATGVAAFHAAALARQLGDVGALEVLLERLLARERAVVAAEVAAALEAQVAHGWESGWQPADVVRSVGRAVGREGTALLRAVIAAEAAGYAELGARAAPGWMRQLELVGAAPSPGSAQPAPLVSGADWRATLLVAVHLMAVLLRLPGLPRLTDPPSVWREGGVVHGGALPDGVLDKVRALLAKAESTTFEAEADTFTAKAQELMARHRIDRALLDAGRPDGAEAPIGRRIEVADPYADAKAALLGGIADANGCRSVWSKGLGFATVFGFAGELAAVEELYTSLLVQAAGALRREGAKHDPSGRSRTKRFRRSFLVAFAVRISDRLRATVDTAVEAAGAEVGTALVPLLAERDARTGEAVEEAFPTVATFSPSATDREGWYAGTAFGDRADLGTGGVPAR